MHPMTSTPSHTGRGSKGRRSRYAARNYGAWMRRREPRSAWCAWSSLRLKGSNGDTNKGDALTVERYAVHSVNSGALVCGPYDDHADAKREVDRLNQEAASGVTAPSE